MSQTPSPVEEADHIWVNGKSCVLPASGGLAQIVAVWLSSDDATPYAVCLNDQHVPQEKISTITLKAGDSVELFTIRQGG